MEPSAPHMSHAPAPLRLTSVLWWAEESVGIKPDLLPAEAFCWLQTPSLTYGCWAATRALAAFICIVWAVRREVCAASTLVSFTT